VEQRSQRRRVHPDSDRGGGDVEKAISAWTINPLTSKKYDDGAAFKQFVMDELKLITGGIRYNVAFPFKGEARVSLVDILYTHFRCPGVHEAAIDDMRLNPDQIVDGRRTAVLKLTDPLGFPELWVETLSTVVWLAEENDAEFGDDPRRGLAVKDAMTKRVTDDRSSFYFGRVK
jgi:hypothetical protein